jgi:hypothetical protein
VPQHCATDSVTACSYRPKIGETGFYPGHNLFVESREYSHVTRVCISMFHSGLWSNSPDFIRMVCIFRISTSCCAVMNWRWIFPEISGQFLHRSPCLCLVLEIRRRIEEGMVTWMNIAFVMQRPLIYRVDYSSEHEKIMAIADLPKSQVSPSKFYWDAGTTLR